ncbi:MAG: tetratricopeptide (TPR) repeat protein, partial [Sulfurimonas sp.]
MFKWILFALVSLDLCALDISLQGARENFQNYSILHIKEKNKFLCEAKKDDFYVTTKIICAFSQAPAKKLKTLQNDFFKIETQINKGTFFVIITPYKKMKLYPVVFELSKDESVYEANVKLSSHWMIVGYNEDLPYIKTHETSDISINFPFMLDKDMLPYVGSLDIKGNPVHLQEVRDVSDYLKIKEYYAKGEYERCLDLVDEVMLEFPTSLFNAELLYYKIRVNSKLENNDDVISFSKVYLREYSSDDNVAEVLALVSKAYAINGIDSQADYFFDRLFSEHEDSPYAKWGYIYKGEMLEDSGESSKALDYYKKALNETSDVEIAASAAYNIARYEINNSAKEEASTYAMKIIDGNPDYFSSKYTTSLEMMYSFADEAEYITASEIANALINDKNKEEEE